MLSSVVLTGSRSGLFGLAFLFPAGSLTLIDGAVVLGIAVVLPLALGGPLWRWPVAAACAAASFVVPPGASAAVLVLPFVAVAAGALVTRLRAAGPVRGWDLAGGADVLAPAWALVAAGALVQSRLGVVLMGIEEPIVALTAVHYVYAGAGTLVLAAAAWRQRPGRAAAAALVLAAGAPPVVAVGFVTGSPVPQVGGAVLMTVAVWLLAALHLGRARDPATARRARLLFAVSGLAPWIPMALAVSWAAGQHVDVPALSIPEMARTHGVANALGFTICGLLALRAARRAAA